MKVNIGKNTLGDSDKMSLSLREYGRSTHDLSFAWRGTMSVGTLVPTMKLVALPGDTFEFNIESKILTVPTVGPLFGSFKFQTDIFTCPIRLYNAMLHNNALNVGLDMSKVKFPTINMYDTWGGYSKAFKFNPTGLLYAMGLKGQSNDTATYNIIPYMAYYDIFKNYYANKQEKNYYQFEGASWEQNVVMQQAIGVLQVGKDSVNRFTIEEEYDRFLINSRTEISTIGGEKVDTLYFKSFKNDENFLRTVYESNSGRKMVMYTLTQKGTENLDKGKVYMTTENGYADLNEPYTMSGGVLETNTEEVPKPHKLEEIDDMREYILSQGKRSIFLTGELDGDDPKQLELLTRLFYDKNYKSTNGGLIVKTHQSDIFNNWINNETISGANGISELTKVDTSAGYFTIDSLNLAKKVYEMLNRIAISGGTYKDWIETVYTTDYYFRAETPVYEGGMSCEIVFDEVVSQSANVETNEPLGTLAGRGMNVNQKGGSVVIKVNEPCYIIAISSITPRLDYSMGNDWDMMSLKTMDDLHKPQLDGIGFQDLIAEKMCWGIANKTIGKQPAWLDYMTNFNRTAGKFAVGESQSFMVLNKIYNNGITNINDFAEAGFTSYIRPSDFNYIFAETQDAAHNFWIQLGYGIEARRVMSAKEMPNP